jgi:CRISPR-associated RAMP protein (TIGR02581 family)
MLKRRLCEARFSWRLSCEGPLLIADGRVAGKKPGNEKKKSPDKVFVSRTPQEPWAKTVQEASTGEDLRKLDFYVPGTSLRGPLRAQAERILRTVIPGAPPATACDPFEQGETLSPSCSKRLSDERTGVPYAKACPACRLFGCTGTAGRIQIPDANFKTFRSVFRDMVGIDRFTGGAYHQKETEEQGKKGALMRFHALEASSFSTEVTITNFELWQLGLLAFVFRDFEEGRISIGTGKTKGFGQVRGKIESIELVYPMGRQQAKLQDLYTLAQDEAERTHYRLHPQEAPPLTMTAKPQARLDFFEAFRVDEPPAFWDAAATAFLDYVKAAQAREVQ